MLTGHLLAPSGAQLSVSESILSFWFLMGSGLANHTSIEMDILMKLF